MLVDVFAGYIPPAEDALVSTGEAGGGLHAAVGLDPVESVFVAASPPSQHGLTHRRDTVSVKHV